MASPEFDLDKGGELAGEGAFGKVFFGKMKVTGEKICVKVTSSKEDTSFVREFELLEKLKAKRGIIQTFGMVDVDDMRCILLERADGALEHLLNMPRYRRGLPTHMVMDLIRDLGSALDTLLRNGIAHRDIKPLNILYFNVDVSGIRKRYEFKLCDFGMGKSVLDAQQTFYTAGGTYLFMAPQILARYAGDWRRPKMSAERSDLWSLGVTLYRAMTGEYPFFPTPFSDKALYEIVNKKLDLPKAIAFKDGEFLESIANPAYPEWISQVFSYLLQFLFNQQNPEVIVKVMEELVTMKGRTFYNIRAGVTAYTFPEESTVHYWFVEDWKLKASDLDVVPLQPYVALSHRGTAEFFQCEKESPRPPANPWTRGQAGQWNHSMMRPPRNSKDLPPFLDSAYVICERPLERAKRFAQMPDEYAKTALEYDQRLSKMGLNDLIAECHSVIMCIFYNTRTLCDISGVLQTHVPIARRTTERLMNESLPRCNLPEIKREALLHDCHVLYRERLPLPFSIEAELADCAQVLHTSNFALEELIDSADEPREKKKQKLAAMCKFLVAAENNLRKAFDKRLVEFMSTARRIIRVSEFEANVQAEIAGVPRPYANGVERKNSPAPPQEHNYQPPPVVGHIHRQPPPPLSVHCLHPFRSRSLEDLQEDRKVRRMVEAVKEGRLVSSPAPPPPAHATPPVPPPRALKPVLYPDLGEERTPPLHRSPSDRVPTDGLFDDLVRDLHISQAPPPLPRPSPRKQLWPRASPGPSPSPAQFWLAPDGAPLPPPRRTPKKREGPCKVS